jgi:hypothetical protein
LPDIDWPLTAYLSDLAEVRPERPLCAGGVWIGSTYGTRKISPVRPPKILAGAVNIRIPAPEFPWSAERPSGENSNDNDLESPVDTS